MSSRCWCKCAACWAPVSSILESSEGWARSGPLAQASPLISALIRMGMNPFWSCLTRGSVCTAEWFRCRELGARSVTQDPQAAPVSPLRSPGSAASGKAPSEADQGRSLPCGCFLQGPALLNEEMASAPSSFSRMRRSLLSVWLLGGPASQNTCFSVRTSSLYWDSWSCIKQHNPQGRLVSFGHLWEVWTNISLKCLTWTSSFLLDIQTLIFFHFKPAANSWHYAISVFHVFV